MSFLEFLHFRDKNLKFANKMLSRIAARIANELVAGSRARAPCVGPECACAKENYSTTSLLLVRMKEPAPMHHAVQATFKCASCGRQFCRTYELFANGKVARWHYYTKTEIIKTIRTSTRSFSYAHLQKCFDAMWSEFNFRTDNCGDWAMEFWDKVLGSGNANWTTERPCECSAAGKYTKRLAWEEVQMLSDDVESLLAFGRQALNHFTNGRYDERLRIGDITHEAVQVIFGCESCGREFRRTYELSGGNSGKRTRWGHYGRRRNEKRHSTERFSFEHVEACFAQMSEDYDLITRNCGHWAREFYEKVVEGA